MIDFKCNIKTISNASQLSTYSHWLVNTQVKYYKLAPDPSYHYEFRYQLLKEQFSHRLILLLAGQNRTCTDWWTFSVQRRILFAMYSANYSIITICTPRLTFEYNTPIDENQDVKWIYKSLQVWMNEVYYAEYRQYPLLYLYGISRGSLFAGLLCRVLPVQAQILYIYPGHFKSMTQRSSYQKELQNRLTLEPSFANWFYFNYCYKTSSDLCFFSSKMMYNFNPIPPTYFVHLVNDITSNVSNYISIISTIINDSFELGGSLLADKQSLKLHTSFPRNITPLYMLKYFYEWHHKPYASQLFYEHWIGFAKLPSQRNAEFRFRTFWCHEADFIFFKRYPSIMNTWTKNQIDEYHDYSNDIKIFHDQLTEEVCGDLTAKHAATSLHIKQTLKWLTKIDELRHIYKIQDFLSRPLRVWVYEKKNLVSKHYRYHHRIANCSHSVYANEMYSPEYFVQDYFSRFRYTDNPLLADYYLIPHDLYCFIFFHRLSPNFKNEKFQTHVHYYSQHYFEPMIMKVISLFPYWNMTNNPGSNHIIAFIGGRNMGVLENHLQNKLKNVIQLGLTGIRQDLLPVNATKLYLHRNLPTVYRHGYDIVIPPYTPTQSININGSDMWYQGKKHLFYFAGNINHSISSKSARFLLATLAQNHSSMIHIKNKELHSITVVDGYVTTPEYVNAISSSIFTLCPEGFSPWSPRIYEAINLQSIPLVLADGIVYPFERFIQWRSFTLKLNVSNINNIFAFVTEHNTSDFERYITEKKKNAEQYIEAFRWPYTPIGIAQLPHRFIRQNDSHLHVFHYIYFELKCRRLEQLHGATSDVLSTESMHIRQVVCITYSTVCPCDSHTSIAFDQYN